MKKSLKYISLIILPTLLFFTGSLLKYAQGPYYFNLSDPSYVYLINALNLAQLSGYVIGHFDHPGTPVQVIAAFIIKIYYLITKENADIVKDVFSRPESYLFLINKFFVLINSIALFFLGLFTYKISKNLYLSFLIQLSPFISKESYYSFIDVSPDNFLIFISLCLIGVLIYYLFKIDTEEKPQMFFIVLFSILCGLGLATKLNFVPLILIPLFIIKGYRNKFTFLIFTFAALLVFMLPALSNYKQFIDWVERLFLNNSMYGFGEPTIINPSTFFENILKIFIQNYVFGVIYIISFAALILNRKKNETDLEKKSFRKESRLLLAVFLALTLQIILVGKHYHPYSQKYMIPAFMLSVTALFLSVKTFFIYSKKYLTKFNLNYVYAVIAVLIFSWNIWQVISVYEILSQQKYEATKIENFIKNNYNGELIIPDLESANRESALAFTTYYAGSQNSNYKVLMSNFFSSNIFYHVWANQILLLSDSVKIKKEILSKKKFIVQLSKFGSISRFLDELKKVIGIENFSCEKVFTNEIGESVYEVSIK